MTGLPATMWVETAPHAYEQADGEDVLAFDVEGDDVAAAHLARFPETTFEPVAWAERQVLLGTILALSLGVFALSLLGWAVIGLVRFGRRRRGRYAAAATSGRGPRERRTSARGLAGGGLAAASWAFVMLVLVSYALGGEEQMFVTEPATLQVAVVLPYGVAVLAIGTAWTALTAWRQGRANRLQRVHHSLLAVLGLALLWPLHVAGFLFG